MKRFIVLILITIMIFTSCASKIDTSQFTEDNPYITENYEINEDMSKVPLEEVNNLYSFSRPTSDVMNYFKRENLMTFRIKKQSSKSYYWETEGKIFFFTNTELEILDKINGDGSEYYENIKLSDTIRVLEYYTVDPNGNFLSANKGWSNLDDSIFEKSPYNKFPYKIMRDNNYKFSYRIYQNDTFSVYPLTYRFMDTDVFPRPHIKSNTEYILCLNNTGLISNELYINGAQIPYELTKGVFYNVNLYELSELAYQKAMSTVEKYGSYEEFENSFNSSFANSYDEYNRVILKIWELYGDRVGK